MNDKMIEIDDRTAVMLTHRYSEQVIGWLPPPSFRIVDEDGLTREEREAEADLLVADRKRYEAETASRYQLPERVYGNKYDRDLSTTEIAKRFRADVKAAVKAGQLPKGLKLSVRTSYFAGGSSIHVSIKTAPGVRVLNPEWVRLHKEQPHRYPEVERHTPELRGLVKTLEALLGAYNHDGSDSQTDYFDVKFYSSVDVAYELEKAEGM